ncbi:hypothetical protein Tco_0568332 [Tanacetum coccineum]
MISGPSSNHEFVVEIDAHRIINVGPEEDSPILACRVQKDCLKGRREKFQPCCDVSIFLLLEQHFVLGHGVRVVIIWNLVSLPVRNGPEETFSLPLFRCGAGLELDEGEPTGSTALEATIATGTGETDRGVITEGAGGDTDLGDERSMTEVSVKEQMKKLVG